MSLKMSFIFLKKYMHTHKKNKKKKKKKQKKKRAKGFSFTYNYVGNWLTCFPHHIEDMAMWSVNHLLYGGRKFWWAISTNDYAKVAHICRQALRDKLPPTKQCKNYLRHKNVFIHPRVCINNGIDVYCIIQEVGDAVILPAGVMHGGFNESLNLAEAVNFMIGETRCWQIGIHTQRRYEYNECEYCAKQIYIDFVGLANKMKSIKEESKCDHTNKEECKKHEDAHKFPPPGMIPDYKSPKQWIAPSTEHSEWDPNPEKILRCFDEEAGGDDMSSLIHKRKNDADYLRKRRDLLENQSIWIKQGGIERRWTGDIEIHPDQLSFQPMYVFADEKGDRCNYSWTYIIQQYMYNESDVEVLSQFIHFDFYCIPPL